MYGQLKKQMAVPSYIEFGNWEKFYIKNPLFRLFASNLFWGIYDGKKLKEVYIYMEDGSYLNIEQEEIKPNDYDKVAILHPAELTEEELEKIKSFIDDYEISQPFNQIEREVFTTFEELYELRDFKGKKVNASAFHYGLTNFGFTRGVVEDNGIIFTYYFETDTIYVTVVMSGFPVDSYYREETIELDYIKFEKFAKKLKLVEVDKRLFSEIYLLFYSL